ncbi:MAG: 2-dehydropantoate 2-reductase [Anaerolineaceae bacterium]|nr:2-dehydropantoate 2-reductase [Anaerolineaceae bacterium]
MSEIRNVAILGAGAIGAAFAIKFFDHPDYNTVLVAEGERKQRLEREGLIVNGKKFLIPTIDPLQTDVTQDLIIVALKYHHMDEAILKLSKLVGDQTIFLSFMNGLDSEEIIAKYYGMHNILFGISVAIDAVREGNQINFSNPGVHYFGAANNERISPNVQLVKDAFEKVGVQYKIPTDMLHDLWWKFMINVGINQSSAILRARYGIFQTQPQAQALMEALMLEVIALAKASNINLTEDDLTGWYPIMHTLSPEGKTSMLQDVEAKRKTEVEMFSGKVVSLGKELGIPTPVNQTIFQIIHVLEQNY